MSTDAPQASTCYCDLWESDPDALASQGLPRGACALCDVCGAPGHAHAGSGPSSGAWCEAHEPGQVQRISLGALLVVLIGVGVALWFLIRLLSSSS